MNQLTPQNQFPILTVRNLPYDTNAEQLYTIFKQFGNINQIRLGTVNPNSSSTGTEVPATKGQAIVVYNNYSSCLKAVEKLRGFNLGGRYIVCSLFQVNKEDADLIRSKISIKNAEEVVNL
ncbi:hypothetical protein CANARDRAFT_26798 [[Candida] arabinofermentans NRRL YB-2248]|uniref:RRM domain-containing protein n=1 Tax=[Candida] arabinofermentans NRRL YB-2248 TaxID=983967 RepID=A0A1E4T6W0_9ASCO|nr:hypothetical protein CANARDRAFT_26798 [[Candida] arabinofermentans NRRL YB-2248]